MTVQPIPEGYHSVAPYLAVDGAEGAITFYEQAFGAKERGRMQSPDGKIAHAELQIGDSVVMLSDPFPGFATKAPTELGATTAAVMLYVEDVDAVVEQAVKAGATIEREVEDQFWGDRFGAVIDPYGHIWSIATHVEDVPPAEMEKRAQEAMAAMSG
jgi:PhnB protein